MIKSSTINNWFKGGRNNYWIEVPWGLEDGFRSGKPLKNYEHSEAGIFTEVQFVHREEGGQTPSHRDRILFIIIKLRTSRKGNRQVCLPSNVGAIHAWTISKATSGITASGNHSRPYQIQDKWLPNGRSRNSRATNRKFRHVTISESDLSTDAGRISVCLIWGWRSAKWRLWRTFLTFIERIACTGWWVVTNLS